MFVCVCFGWTITLMAGWVIFSKAFVFVAVPAQMCVTYDVTVYTRVVMSLNVKCMLFPFLFTLATHLVCEIFYSARLLTERYMQIVLDRRRTNGKNECLFDWFATVSGQLGIYRMSAGKIVQHNLKSIDETSRTQLTFVCTVIDHGNVKHPDARVFSLSLSSSLCAVLTMDKLSY